MNESFESNSSMTESIKNSSELFKTKKDDTTDYLSSEDSDYSLILKEKRANFWKYQDLNKQISSKNKLNSNGDQIY